MVNRAPFYYGEKRRKSVTLFFGKGVSSIDGRYKVVKSTDNRAAPSISCDHCGQLIDDAEMALAMWHSKDNTLTEDGKIYLVHKHCHIEFENNDPVAWKSNELRHFLRRLVFNIKANITEDSGSEMLDNTP